MPQRRWFVYAAVGVLVLISTAVLQAQDILIGRVTETRGTEETAIEIPLGTLDVNDEVTIELTRLTGDLIPIVALKNKTDDRYVYRYRDINFDGKLDAPDETYYQLNEEAGSGTYIMLIAADPEIDDLTTGDYLLTYTVQHRGKIVTGEKPIVAYNTDMPIILISPPAADKPVVLSGVIDDETFRVDYLIHLSAAAPLQFTLTAENGDLIPLLGISPADQEAFTVPDAVDGVVSVVYPALDNTGFRDGNYVLAVSREGVDDGESSGTFRLEISRAVEEK